MYTYIPFIIIIHLFIHYKKELDDLIESCRKFNRNISNFDCSVFNGHYITGDVTEEYLKVLESTRSDSAKDIISNGMYYEPDTTSNEFR